MLTISTENEYYVNSVKKHIMSLFTEMRREKQSFCCVMLKKSGKGATDPENEMYCGNT